MTGGVILQSKIIAHADERAIDFIFGGDFFNSASASNSPAARRERFNFSVEPDLFRDSSINKFVQIFAAEEGEHLAGFGGIGADMAADEGIKGVEKFSDGGFKRD